MVLDVAWRIFPCFEVEMSPGDKVSASLEVCFMKQCIRRGKNVTNLKIKIMRRGMSADESYEFKKEENNEISLN